MLHPRPIRKCMSIFIKYHVAFLFRNIDFTSVVTRGRILNNLPTASLLVRQNVEVTLICRYLATISVSTDEFGIFERPFIKIKLQIMTTIKIENALLDPNTMEFKAAANEIETKVMNYWHAQRSDTPPFFVKLEVFMPLADYNAGTVF